MHHSFTTRESAVQHYLATGEHDVCFRGWPGSNLLDAARAGDALLRTALIAQVRSRSAPAGITTALQAVDFATLTRSKVAPMVRGLFPLHERALVLAMLERSVVFLTPNNIESVLRSTPWLDTAWSLANLYLDSIGAERISHQARAIVGLSEETTCYVSLDYFADQDPCADYLLHEAAHIFHNCKRTTVGLPETRRREWLLDIDFGKRETFAYACEAYGRILVLGDTPARRRDALVAHTEGPPPGDETVDAESYFEILREAVGVRNGWKAILRRCAPSRLRRPAASTTEAAVRHRPAVDHPT